MAVSGDVCTSVRSFVCKVSTVAQLYSSLAVLYIPQYLPRYTYTWWVEEDVRRCFAFWHAIPLLLPSWSKLARVPALPSSSIGYKKAISDATLLTLLGNIFVVSTALCSVRHYQAGTHKTQFSQSYSRAPTRPSSSSSTTPHNSSDLQ